MDGKGSQMKVQVSRKNKMDGRGMFTKIQILRYENNHSFRSTTIPSLLLLFQRIGFFTGGRYDSMEVTTHETYLNKLKFPVKGFEDHQ